MRMCGVAIFRRDRVCGAEVVGRPIETGTRPHRWLKYELDAPARDLGHSPRWRVGLVWGRIPQPHAVHRIGTLETLERDGVASSWPSHQRLEEGGRGAHRLDGHVAMAAQLDMDASGVVDLAQ